MGGSPGMCFLIFCSKSELTPCVFEVFWISGFPVPVRERLPKGNLPLSEVPPSEHLTECRRIPEEFQRKSGGIKRPVGGKPHASRAGRHGGGYIHIHTNIRRVSQDPQNPYISLRWPRPSGLTNLLSGSSQASKRQVSQLTNMPSGCPAGSRRHVSQPTAPKFMNLGVVG